MNPEISSFPNSQFYDNQIVDSKAVCLNSRRFHVASVAPIVLRDAACRLVDSTSSMLNPYNVLNVVQGRERRDKGGGSYYNVREAELAAELCAWFLGECDDDSKNKKRQRETPDPRISIITFYSAQVRAIQQRLSRHVSDVRVSTVDSFQGSESDVVILSCVRSNSKNAVGFVSEFRRLNVALTRAKLGIVVLCHAQTLENGPSKDLKMLVGDARKRGMLIDYLFESDNPS